MAKPKVIKSEGQIIPVINKGKLIKNKKPRKKLFTKRKSKEEETLILK